MTYVFNVDSEQFMIDSLPVKAHACASGYEINGNKLHALGRSVGGFTTKIDTVTNALGNPIRFMLSAGNMHDIISSQNLLKDIKNALLLADKVLDFTALLTHFV